MDQNLTVVVLFTSRYQNQDTEELELESTLIQELQRQMSHQMQINRSNETATKSSQGHRISDVEQELLKDNQRLVKDTDELRKKLKRAEERIRNLEKLFRDSHKHLSPKEVKLVLSKKIGK